MLEVTRLSRSYGDYLAVKDVSFSIQSGEIVGLLGHNGAGKTTIMKMLSGYLEPDAGTVSLDGLDLAYATKAVQRRIGYLPENLRKCQWRTTSTTPPNSKALWATSKPTKSGALSARLN
jgi:ABC-2 type transport system ATP-binding protein